MSSEGSTSVARTIRFLFESPAEIRERHVGSPCELDREIPDQVARTRRGMKKHGPGIQAQSLRAVVERGPSDQHVTPVPPGCLVRRREIPSEVEGQTSRRPAAKGVCGFRAFHH
jgi:hypothetical protein